MVVMGLGWKNPLLYSTSQTPCPRGVKIPHKIKISTHTHKYGVFENISLQLTSTPHSTYFHFGGGTLCTDTTRDDWQ